MTARLTIGTTSIIGRTATVLAAAGLVLAGGVIVGAAPALAVTDCPNDGSSQWINTVGGDWSVPANWSNGVPGGSCTAAITLPGTYTVTVTVGQAAAGVTLGGTSGTQTLQIQGNTRGDGSQQGAVLGVGAGNLSIAPHGVLQYTGSGTNPGEATTTGNGTIINSGLVRTDQGSLAGTRDIQNGVTNNVDGHIDLHTNTITCSCGNTHYWANSGTITTDSGTTSTFSGTAQGVLFTQSAGTFVNHGRAEVSGGFTFNGGTTAGNPIEICGFLAAPGSGVGSFEFEPMPDVNCGNGEGEFTGDVGPNTQVLVHAGTNSLLTNVSAGVTNHGTITMTGGPGQPQLNGQPLSNAGTIHLSAAPSGASALVTSALTNTGTLDVAAGSSAFMTHKFIQSGGTLTTGVGATLQANSDTDLTGGIINNNGTFISNGQLNHTGGSMTGNPLELCGGNLNAPGPGTASFVIGAIGNCSTMGFDGDIGTSDSVLVESPGDVIDVFFPGFTNRGTLSVVSDAAHLVQMHVSGSDPLVNDGTLRTTGSNFATKIVNNGTWTVPDSTGLSTNFNEPITQAAGTLTVDGALNTNSGLTISGGALQGNGTLTSDVINSGGTVRAGHAASGIPATLAIVGDYTQGAAGLLDAYVAGSSVGTGYSQVSVSGTVSLAGALHVTTTHAQQGPLHVLMASSRTGTFDTSSFTGQTFNIAYPAGGVDLTKPAAPVATTPPAVHGTVAVGRTLTATKGTFTGSPTSYRYAWLRCNTAAADCAAITGATHSTHRVTTTDVGHRLRVRVTAVAAGGQGTSTSAATKTVPRPPFTVTAVSFAPMAFTAAAGTTAKFRISLGATVSIAITHRVTGHRRNGRCSTTGHIGARCTAVVTVAKVSHTWAAGAHQVRLALRSLHAGSYTATVRARDKYGRLLVVTRRLTVQPAKRG